MSTQLDLGGIHVVTDELGGDRRWKRLPEPRVELQLFAQTRTRQLRVAVLSEDALIRLIADAAKALTTLHNRERL